ncbi:high-affinity iron permease [Linnemannia schmuckeri]|uniref:High-affinity iron permease n=1 Tax=Linnemannia schmuckeri TaxID=64567 RepID=A0A9P5RZ22_9FUNG|nr:high-affinity iron permease [Linnemannia schmuckeri]
MSGYLSIPTFFIIFRETVEAAIIVSVLLSFLRQVLSDDHVMRKRLSRQIWAGTGLGLLISLAIGGGFILVWNWYGKNLWAASEGIWVGCFSFIAVLMITLIGIAMLRTNQMQEKWKLKLAKAMDDENANGLGNQSRKYALFLLPLVTVLREGLEAVVFIGGVTFTEDPKAIPLAVVAGVALGLLIGFLIYRGGNKMRLHPFFVGSTCLLMLLAAGLVSKGVAAFEADHWNRLTGAQSDDAGTFDPRYNLWALKCCDPKQPDAGWWSVANALVGWSNIASYWTVGSYIMYWGLVSAWLIRLNNKRVQKATARGGATASRPLLSAGSSATDLEEDGEVYTPVAGSSSEQTLIGYEGAEGSIHGGHQPHHLTRRHDGYGAVGNAGTTTGAANGGGERPE